MDEKCVCHINGYRLKDTEARQKATTAGQMANGAMEKAIDVESQIAQAVTMSNRAKTTADGAVVTAKAAYTTAEAAEKTAAAAQTAADGATLAAKVAENTANGKVSRKGDTMEGALDMGNNEIENAMNVQTRAVILREHNNGCDVAVEAMTAPGIVRFVCPQMGNRVIVRGVAPGVADTDAVNMAQVREMVRNGNGSDSGQNVTKRTQYIKKSNLVSNYFWWTSENSPLPYKYKYNGFVVLEPIILDAGTYYLTALTHGYSHIVINGVVRKLHDFEPSAANGENFVLNLTEPATLYLTYAATQVSNTTPYIVSGNDPLNEYYEEPFTNTNLTVAYIKNCELVANDLKLDTLSQGHYTGVKMGANVKKLMCKARFIEGCAFALVSTKNGIYTVADITKSSIHIVFNLNSCTVGVFDSQDSLRTVTTIPYSWAVEGAVRAFGYEINESANELIVYLPDGATSTVSDESFAAVNGPYAIWEHFCSRDDLSTPFTPGAFTKLWCKDVNGEILDDNLKRPDGAIGVAPTGQVYRQINVFNSSVDFS